MDVALGEVQDSIKRCLNSAYGTSDRPHALRDLNDCIARGRLAVADDLKDVREKTIRIKEIWQLLQPETDVSWKRHSDFDRLAAQLAESTDPMDRHMGNTMQSFEPGLFAGAGDAELPVDNLDLERSFRLPKSHERRIHGRAHAGVRIVQQGPTLLFALQAHQRHPAPFEREQLVAYLDTPIPEGAELAISRPLSSVNPRFLDTQAHPLVNF